MTESKSCMLSLEQHRVCSGNSVFNFCITLMEAGGHGGLWREGVRSGWRESESMGDVKRRAQQALTEERKHTQHVIWEQGFVLVCTSVFPEAALQSLLRSASPSAPAPWRWTGIRPERIQPRAVWPSHVLTSASPLRCLLPPLRQICQTLSAPIGKATQKINRDWWQIKQSASTEQWQCEETMCWV